MRSSVVKCAGRILRAEPVATQHAATFSHYSAAKRLISPSAVRDVENKSDYIDFNRVLPDVIKELTESQQRLRDVPSANKWLARVLQYNLSGGKKHRGLAVVSSFKQLAHENEQSPQNIHRAQVMGWCLEMLHSSVLMTEDTLFEAQTRRGKPCWYLSPKSQVTRPIAINDAALVETSIYQLLHSHFKDQPYYLNVLELFHEVSHKAMMGQVIDMQTRLDKTLEEFTMNRYQVITKYKKSLHSFLMPVSLAMYMAGFNDTEIHRQAKAIQLEMGQFFQLLEDYIDCYGLPSLQGQEGTNIQDAKCTWLVVVALQRATNKQRHLLQECYGSKDAEKVNIVKALYNDLGLPQTFKLYEEQSFDLLRTQIQQSSRGLPHKLFLTFLDKLYPRGAQ